MWHQTHNVPKEIIVPQNYFIKNKILVVVFVVTAVDLSSKQEMNKKNFLLGLLI